MVNMFGMAEDIVATNLRYSPRHFPPSDDRIAPFHLRTQRSGADEKEIDCSTSGPSDPVRFELESGRIVDSVILGKVPIPSEPQLLHHVQEPTTRLLRT